MPKRKAIGAAALLALVLALAGWSTQESSGNGNASYYHLSATGAVMGAGTALGTGNRYLSMASYAANATGTIVLVYSKSCAVYPQPMSITFGGRNYDGFFRQGIDSLHVVTNGSGILIASAR